MSIPPGMFNVKKCIEYLRHVNVEVARDMAIQWDLAERAHRFAASMKRQKRQGYECYCKNGHFTYVEWRRGQRRKGRKPTSCKECGEPMQHRHLRFTELRDGTVRDYRDAAEQWKPLDDPRQT